MNQCPTCLSALGRREIAFSMCSSPWHDRGVQPPATSQTTAAVLGRAVAGQFPAPPQKPARVDVVAREIAKELMSNGFGDQGDWLMIQLGSQGVGGWSLEGAARQIRITLEQEGYVLDRMAEATRRAQLALLASAQPAVRSDIERPDYKALDPGIRDVVRLLNDHGFQTTDSGDGLSKPAEWYESGCAMPFPNVAMTTTRETMIAAADRAQALLGDGWTVEASYSSRSRDVLLLARTLDPRESRDSKP